MERKRPFVCSDGGREGRAEFERSGVGIAVQTSATTVERFPLPRPGLDQTVGGAEFWGALIVVKAAARAHVPYDLFIDNFGIMKHTSQILQWARTAKCPRHSLHGRWRLRG